MGVSRRQIFGGVLLLLFCFSSLAFADVTGDYELREKGELRRLSVNELKGAIQFILDVEAGDFDGSMMGTAALKGNTATYKTGGCQFTITFSGNKALIRHAGTQCRDYLKPGVRLDGNYIKVP
ncbi:MAG: hypothetical protein M1438_10890 [Deltaproteobacteria bacterium]|nr:hypothetical protein [Deltaproteobacteria bacterium]